MTSKILSTTFKGRQQDNELTQNSLAINYLELSIKHKAAISELLTHRLKIAKANQNTKLVSLLEQERQLEENPQPAQVNFWNWLTQPKQISVKQIPSSSGTVMWEGYNPRTGETRLAETEAEMIDWLEHQS